jgi:GNAT superfamily N-acetyltransferase
MRDVQLRPLTGVDDVHVVQRVLDHAPDYAYRVTGKAPVSSGAAELFAALPPGIGYDAKHVYGIVVDGLVVGCVDLIRGWPAPTTAHIGLLVLEETHAGRGVGRAAYQAIEDLVRQWPEIDHLRAAVVATNDIVLPFWRAMGLTETGESKPYVHGQVISRALVLAKRLRTTKRSGM